MRPAINLENVVKEFDLVRGMQPTLKASVLSFKRPKIERARALKGITLKIDKGETVAIIGRNGSGKSTLLRIVGRVYKPSSGIVEVDGRMSTMLDLGAGFHPELTGLENIYFNAAIMGLSTAQTQAKLQEIIDFSELSEFIDSPVRTYSAGMLMRLGFAIAIETDPDILLVDEVLAVGDAAFQEKCYERIDSYKCSGRTIVFVTHDLPAARSVASRTVWIQKGEVQKDGGTDETIDAYLATILKTDHSHTC